jgi:hypothetical protein
MVAERCVVAAYVASFSRSFSAAGGRRTRTMKARNWPERVAERRSVDLCDC